jgi:hypothetical protein
MVGVRHNYHGGPGRGLLPCLREGDVLLVSREPPMRSLALPAAILAIVLWGLPAVPPFGGPPPQRQIEERPFGGPPPRGRSIQPDGVVCRTATSVCKLDKARPLGAACSCPPGPNGVPGKVE